MNSVKYLELDYIIFKSLYRVQVVIGLDVHGILVLIHTQ